MRFCGGASSQAQVRRWQSGKCDLMNWKHGMEVDQVEASTAALGIWLVLVPGILVDCSTTGYGRERKNMPTRLAMLAAVHPQSCGVVATWSFFSQIKKRRLATWTPRPCHGDDGLFPEAGGAATTTAAAAMQKTRKRAVDGEPNVMENLDQITTNKSLFS